MNTTKKLPSQSTMIIRYVLGMVVVFFAYEISNAFLQLDKTNKDALAFGSGAVIVILLLFMVIRMKQYEKIRKLSGAFEPTKEKPKDIKP